jgi:hypothetical protein
MDLHLIASRLAHPYDGHDLTDSGDYHIRTVPIVRKGAPMPEFQFLEDPKTRLTFTCAGTDPDRLVAAFEHVSMRIPVDERKLMLDHWAAHAPAPAISIDDVAVFRVTMVEGRSIAIGLNATGQGLAFRFAGQAITEMPTDILHTLIAHELARCVINVQLFARSLPPEEQKAWSSLDNDFGNRAELAKQLSFWSETWADKRTLRWDSAFDCTKLREWTDQFLKKHGFFNSHDE